MRSTDTVDFCRPAYHVCGIREGCGGSLWMACMVPGTPYLVIGGEAMGVSDDLVVVLPQDQQKTSDGPVPDGILHRAKFDLAHVNNMHCIFTAAT